VPTLPKCRRNELRSDSLFLPLRLPLSKNGSWFLLVKFVNASAGATQTEV